MKDRASGRSCRRSRDGLFLLLRLLGRLALVELGRHLDQDLGILGEIVAHDLLDDA